MGHVSIAARGDVAVLSADRPPANAMDPGLLSDVLAAAEPRDADAWNELAHAYRKSGDLDNAFKCYDKALQIDPKHRNAHEYLGEAYLQAGDVARAEAQLVRLDKLCFLPCEQYSDLKEEIRRYKADHPVASR